LKAVSERYNISFDRIKNPNSAEFLEEVRACSRPYQPYSAPVVFKEALLKIPKHGCINLHCSFLSPVCWSNA
jgi:methionyl-tRNA formyltransferase